MKVRTAAKPLHYTVDRHYRYVIINPGINAVVVAEADLIGMLADLQDDLMDLADAAGL